MHKQIKSLHIELGKSIESLLEALSVAVQTGTFHNFLIYYCLSQFLNCTLAGMAHGLFANSKACVLFWFAASTRSFLERTTMFDELECWT